MRTLWLFALAALALPILAGCGGGAGGGKTVTEPGSIQISVAWPTRDRVIPRAADSLVIRVHSGAFDVTKTIDRPTTTTTFAEVPPGNAEITTFAYSELGGAGAVVARGVTTETVKPSQAQTVTISLNSVIDRVEIAGLPDEEVGVETSLSSTLTGFNAANEMVPIDPTAVNWTSGDTTVARFEGSNLRTLAAGTTRITAVDIESGKSATHDLVVSNAPGTLGVAVVDDMAPIRVKLLVLSYNPVIPSTGKRVFASRPEYTDPGLLTTGFIKEMREVTNDVVQYDLVEFRTLDYLPTYLDGTRLEPQEYFDRMMAGTLPRATWLNQYKMLADEHVDDLVNRGLVDEVFVYYDGPNMNESWMLGPRSFYINGGEERTFPTTRPFVVMGFTPFVKTGNMLHSLGHRSEDTLQRFFGNWNLAHPVTRFDHFSANVLDSPTVTAGVGTTHVPPNGREHYDTFNPTPVRSTAPSFLVNDATYGQTAMVSRNAWSDALGGMDGIGETQVETERGFQRWRFRHFPRFAGLDAEGKLNNWWRYMYQFDSYQSHVANRSRSANPRAACVLRR